MCAQDYVDRDRRATIERECDCDWYKADSSSTATEIRWVVGIGLIVRRIVREEALLEGCRLSSSTLCLLSATASPWSDVTSFRAGVATAFGFWTSLHVPINISTIIPKNQIFISEHTITTSSRVLADTSLHLFP